MATVRVKIKNKLKIDCFYKESGKNYRYFVGVFNKTIILHAFIAKKHDYSQFISNGHSWNNR